MVTIIAPRLCIHCDGRPMVERPPVFGTTPDGGWIQSCATCHINWLLTPDTDGGPQLPHKYERMGKAAKMDYELAWRKARTEAVATLWPLHLKEVGD